MTTAKKPKSFKVTKHVAHVSPQPAKDKRGPITGSKIVTVAGVAGGHQHRVYTHGEHVEDRTVCGNWPGRPQPVPDAPLCPVCFRSELRGS